MNRFFNIVLFSLLGLSLVAQSLHFRMHSLDPNNEGLHFTKLIERSDGLLYLGSNLGLFIYDGFALTKVQGLDTLLNTEITVLSEGQDQTIWIGGKSGQIVSKALHAEAELWEHIPDINAPIIALKENKFGGLWVATYGQGLYYYQKDSLFHFTIEDGLLGNDIYTIETRGNHEVWAATDAGITICSIEKGEKKIRNITKDQGLPDEIIKEIIKDEKGNFWLGTHDKGICYLNTATETVDYISPEWSNGPINELVLFEDRELWIGTDQKGLWRFSIETHQLDFIEVGENGKKIYDLKKDSEGILWVLNHRTELYSANRRFEYIKTDFNSIQAFLSQSKHTIWIGTQEGLFLYDIKQPEKTKALFSELNLNVVSLYQDTYKNIWIGTFGQGLYIYNPETKALRHLTEKDGLTNESILSITATSGQVWLATLGGITEIVCESNILELAKPSIKNYNSSSAIGANFIYKVFADSKSRIWFCTDGKGLSALVDGKIENYSVAGNETIKTVYSIAEDKNGTIWMSADNNRIFEFDGIQLIPFNAWKTFRNKDIASLASDKRGNIIIIHNEGLDILNPDDRKLTYFSGEVGLENFEPNLNAAYRDPYHNLWIGNQYQILKFVHLEEAFRTQPKTILEKISINNDWIAHGQVNDFNHSQNNLIFKFNSKWFTNPGAVEYRYQLKGVDPDWIYTKDRQATYFQLLPGSYEFVVNTALHGDFHKDNQLSYAFQIAKPFWQQWWFLFLMSILGIGFIYFIMRYRENQFQREALLKKEKIESQFEALKSQINPHFLFNCFNTLVAIIEENSNLAVKYVEQLSDYYRNIIQYREKEVIDLDEELELVKSYAFLLKERFGDTINIQYELKGEQTYIAPLTLQMLVENAVKHNVISIAKPLHIKILENENYIYVSNNLQPKLVKERSTGFGLQNINNRYHLLTDKKIKIEQDDTVFKVGIPKIIISDL